MTTGWSDAWEQALDALELDVAAAELLLAAAHGTGGGMAPAVRTWRPPVDLGPLPASLEERARTLRDRQLEVAKAVSEAVVRSRRQLAATRAVLGTVAERRPVYVDIDG
ncbi:hypothetical protein [Cellulomonas sp. NTE-D12]|uniref:hypothetical protein n=1 Tax=Cellulomonas sp. NTE-D12 TaxID=2962632 RepID=UPI0030815E8D|nr:hypothetical protein CELD12_29310 [Cellulomonas sp. NTE-D12]